MRSLACSMVMAQRRPSPSRSRRGVLVQVPRLTHFRGAKLDVEGVRLKEVGDFHGMNDLEGNPIVPIMDGRRP